MADIDNSEDILNSKDIEDRIDDLEGDRAALEEDRDNAQEAYDDFMAERDQSEDGETADESEEGRELADALAFARKALADWDTSDEAEELKTLKAFRDELEPYVADWHYGETIIRDSYFEEYARDLAEDLHGNAIRGASWPFDCIDWKKAARELQMDYTSAEFDGVTYWAR